MPEEVEEKEQIWDATGFDEQSFFGQMFFGTWKVIMFPLLNHASGL